MNQQQYIDHRNNYINKIEYLTNILGTNSKINNYYIYKLQKTTYDLLIHYITYQEYDNNINYYKEVYSNLREYLRYVINCGHDMSDEMNRLSDDLNEISL